MFSKATIIEIWPPIDTNRYLRRRRRETNRPSPICLNVHACTTVTHKYVNACPVLCADLVRALQTGELDMECMKRVIVDHPRC
jgi:hypothetical protein